jgi:hypothetical protein
MKINNIMKAKIILRVKIYNNKTISIKIKMQKIKAYINLI